MKSGKKFAFVRGFLRQAITGIWLGVLAAVLFFAGARGVLAASGDYQASLIKVSDLNLTLSPGEERSITVTLKNVGKQTWKQSGRAYVSYYTWEPKYHASQIAGSGWKSSSQTGAIASEVAPGKTGTLSFKIKAPSSAGTYNEHFQLAAEDTAWVSGAKLALTVIVTGSAAPTANGTTLGATRLLMSTDRLKLKGSERAEISVLFKNTGTAVWGVRKLVQASGLKIAAGAMPVFSDASWPASDVALSVNETVLPGRTVPLKFALRAPREKGEYNVRFKLVVDEKEVPGGFFDIQVSVTEDGPAAANPEPGPGGSQTPVPSPSELVHEPTIRVGVATVPVKSLIFSGTSQFSVQDAGGNEIGTVPAGIAATVLIGPGGALQITGASKAISVSGLVRFVPSAGGDAASKVNAGGAESWSSWVNGARFRGTLEVRYYTPADVTWLINELPFEKYLYGLAEMSNGAPYEYQKALITAARTYAYWHLTHPGKHITFTVDSTYDQVYRGHDRELQQPNIVRAVEETRGQIVHYSGAPVVTPYYANSDGRTRAWTEVWGGGAKPWLVSVEAKYDKGKKLWGHGVGMSARDAAYRADEDKWSWDQLLKYYYTSIDLKRLW